VSSNLGGVDENRTGGFTAGASGLNLRGIGSQATLVLINGRRLALTHNLNIKLLLSI
jgi:iron complex outermembrane receptor protein